MFIVNPFRRRSDVRWTNPITNPIRYWRARRAGKIAYDRGGWLRWQFGLARMRLERPRSRRAKLAANERAAALGAVVVLEHGVIRVLAKLGDGAARTQLAETLQLARERVAVHELPPDGYLAGMADRATLPEASSLGTPGA